MCARCCSRKHPTRCRVMTYRWRSGQSLAAGCAARCTRCARHPLCSKPGSIPCANRRGSRSLDRSLRLIPGADRNFPDSRGFARAVSAHYTQRRLEQIRASRESFGQHLELIEAIDPKTWNPADLHKELSRALSTVDDARTVYNEQRSRLQAAGGHEGDASLPDVGTDAYESSDGRSFVQWFQIGVALTLPLIIFGAVALALFVWMASK